MTRQLYIVRYTQPSGMPRSDLNCLICNTRCLTEASYWPREGGIGRVGPFCTAEHAETWLTLDDNTRLLTIFGNVTRARLFLRDREMGHYPQDARGAVSHVPNLAGESLPREKQLCPQYPNNSTGMNPGCADCRPVAVRWTELRHDEVSS